MLTALPRASFWLHWCWTLLLAVLLSTLVQTQFNLLALQQLGVSIPWAERLATSGHDLLNFTPVYLVLFASCYLIAMPLAHGLSSRLQARWRPGLFALAAAVGLWLTLMLVDALAPMPTLIAASRSFAGLLSLLLIAALAAVILAWLTADSAGRSNSRSDRQGAGQPLMLLPLLLLLPGIQPPAIAETELQLDTLVRGLEHPWSLAFLPTGPMLVTERPGRLRLIHTDGRLEPEPIGGLPEVFASGQAGLFDVVAAPDFGRSQEIFLSYACGSMRANHTCLARARLDLSQLKLTELTEIFRTYPAKTGNAHYGGRVVFLDDGSLVLSLGDGFDYREEAQRLSSHLGALVRLWPDGSVPDDNPFVGQSGALAEIFSWGHRNVQGLVYDGDRQQLLSHEHGPKGGDELNRIVAGANYGWPVVTQGIDYTGARITPFTQFDGMTAPLLDWTPSIAPSGLALYRGELFADWQGDLLVGALAGRQLQRVRLTDDAARIEQVLLIELAERIRDVRVGPDGAIYLLTDDARGRLLRLSPSYDDGATAW